MIMRWLLDIGLFLNSVRRLSNQKMMGNSSKIRKKWTCFCKSHYLITNLKICFELSFKNFKNLGKSIARRIIFNPEWSNFEHTVVGIAFGFIVCEFLSYRTTDQMSKSLKLNKSKSLVLLSIVNTNFLCKYSSKQKSRISGWLPNILEIYLPPYQVSSIMKVPLILSHCN